MPTDDELEALIARSAPTPAAGTRDRVLGASYAARAGRRRAPRVRWWALAAALALACDAGYAIAVRPARRAPAAGIAAAPAHDAVALAALIARVGPDAAARTVTP